MSDDQAPREVPEVRYETGPTHEPQSVRWPLVVSGLAVGTLLIGMLVMMPFLGQPGTDPGSYDEHRVGDHVSVDGRRIATTDTAYLPDVRMVAVGRTDEGYRVYVDSHQSAGGGGGGMPPRGAALSAYGELWVRTGPDTYKRVKLSR